MSKIPQTSVELNKHLVEQIRFLKTSANLYDKGDTSEAKRMALTIRLLLHDTSSSKSLLAQLGSKSIKFVDSATDWNPKNLISHHGLVMLKAGTAGAFVPKIDLPFRQPPSLDEFDPWWTKVVIVDSHKNKFSRKDLILSITNKDGGAHIDPELEESYAELTRFNSVGWMVIENCVKRELTGVELASIREIAWEVLESINKAGIIT